MAKTQEELKQLKTEYESLTNKLKELTEDELKEVSGGAGNTPDVVFHCSYVCPLCGEKHTLDYKFGSTVFHQEVLNYNACSLTSKVYLTGGPYVSVVNTEGILYKVTYTTDSYTM